MGKISEGELEARLQRADHSDFRQLIGAVWQRRGWNVSIINEDMHVTCTRSTPEEQTKLAIQCHRYQSDNPVTRTEIEEHSVLAARDDVDDVIVVTTSRFTDGARRTAESYGITLMGPSEIIQSIEQVDGEDLVRGLTTPTITGMLRRSIESILPGGSR